MHANVLEILCTGDVGVADGALINFDLEGVGIMASDASVITFDVVEASIIGLAFVLVTALDLCTIASCCRGVIKDVDKAEIFANGIRITR